MFRHICGQCHFVLGFVCISINIFFKVAFEMLWRVWLGSSCNEFIFRLHIWSYKSVISTCRSNYLKLQSFSPFILVELETRPPKLSGMWMSNSHSNFLLNCTRGFTDPKGFKTMCMFLGKGKVQRQCNHSYVHKQSAFVVFFYFIFWVEDQTPIGVVLIVLGIGSLALLYKVECRVGIRMCLFDGKWTLPFDLNNVMWRKLRLDFILFHFMFSFFTSFLGARILNWEDNNGWPLKFKMPRQIQQNQTCHLRFMLNM